MELRKALSHTVFSIQANTVPDTNFFNLKSISVPHRTAC